MSQDIILTELLVGRIRIPSSLVAVDNIDYVPGSQRLAGWHASEPQRLKLLVYVAIEVIGIVANADGVYPRIDEKQEQKNITEVHLDV